MQVLPDPTDPNWDNWPQGAYGYTLDGVTRTAYGSATSSPNTAATMTGAITTTYQWFPSGDNDPAPQSVIVLEHCEVLAQSWSTFAGSAQADNGLGGTPQDDIKLSGDVDADGNPIFYEAKTCSSDKYSVKGGDSFTVTSSPSVSASGDQGAGVGLSYSVTIYPVTLSLAGTVQESNGSLHILIGQKLRATMSAGDPGSFSWSFDSAHAFGDYTTSQESAVLTNALTEDNQASNPIEYFYSQPEGDTVKCSATYMGMAISAQQSLSVEAPTWNDIDKSIKSNSGPGGQELDNQSTYELFDSGTRIEIGILAPGFNYTVKVLTPSVYSTGSYRFFQTTSPGRNREVYNPNDYAQKCYQSFLGNSFSDMFDVPNYASAPLWVADGQDQESWGDTPAHTTISADCEDLYTASDSFSTYLMFLPPDNGIGSVYVPLESVNWSYTCSANRFPAGVWTPSVAPTSMFSMTYPAIPTWSTFSGDHHGYTPTPPWQ